MKKIPRKNFAALRQRLPLTDISDKNNGSLRSSLLSSFSTSTITKIPQNFSSLRFSMPQSKNKTHYSQRSAVKKKPNAKLHLKNHLEIYNQKSHMLLYWYTRSGLGHIPEARESSTLAIQDLKMYLYGGQSHKKHAEIRVLNLLTNQWRVIPCKSPPKGRYGHSMIVYKHSLVIYGGYISKLSLTYVSRKVHIFNTQSNSWSTISGKGEIPAGRSHSGVCRFGKEMIIYGGVTQEKHKSRDLILFDLSEHVWLSPSISKLPRLSHTTLTPVVHDSLKQNFEVSVFNMSELRDFARLEHSGLYMFGGVDSREKATNKLYRLLGSCGKLNWEEVETSGVCPSPRFGHTAGSIGSKLFIYAGRNDSPQFAQQFNALSDLHVLDVSTFKWEQVLIHGNVPLGRWGCAMQEFKTGFIMFGGISVKNFMSADLYYLEADDNTAELLKKRDEAVVQENIVQTRKIVASYKRSLRKLMKL